jgi:hypothetical protein
VAWYLVKHSDNFPFTFVPQAKRAVSAVTIRQEPADPEMCLSMSRHQLSASISCDALHDTSCHTSKLSPCQPVLYFWTPGYWYCPKSSVTVYQELRCHLLQLHSLQNCSSTGQGDASLDRCGTDGPLFVSFLISFLLSFIFPAFLLSFFLSFFLSFLLSFLFLSAFLSFFLSLLCYFIFDVFKMSQNTQKVDCLVATVITICIMIIGNRFLF